MRRFVAFVAVGVVAAFTATASAQSGGICQLSGTSNIGGGGIPASATPVAPAMVPFDFTGDLSNCGGEGSGGQTCAVGSVTGSCQGNTHEADYAICSGTCDVSSGTPTCTGTTLASGSLQGVCVGAVCVGGDAGVPGGLYSLVFTPETVQAALEECADSEAGAIETASFEGAIGFGGP